MRAPTCFNVRITETAKEMLREIRKTRGKKTYEVLRDRILDLQTDPAKKGLPLRRPLHGLYALHHSRYRVIYRINKDAAQVVAVAVGYHRSGARDDIYRVVHRLVQSGIIQPDNLDV